VIYREAVLDDLPRLLEIEQLLVAAERPFDASIKADKTFYYDITEQINSRNVHLVVLEHDANIVAVGYAKIRTSKPAHNHTIHAYLGFMYVSPHIRGQGVNRHILGLLTQWSRDNGAEALYLDVYSQNSSAIRAYEKVGFAPCLVEMKLIL
jgi:GNAT superfamily N-acetyltransferase|tara:strand:+ start:6787 stop:7239 length:453 start_codon:yes stop_codon:yes gene_type:complete